MGGGAVACFVRPIVGIGSGCSSACIGGDGDCNRPGASTVADDAGCCPVNGVFVGRVCFGYFGIVGSFGFAAGGIHAYQFVFAFAQSLDGVRHAAGFDGDTGGVFRDCGVGVVILLAGIDGIGLVASRGGHDHIAGSGVFTNDKVVACSTFGEGERLADVEVHRSDGVNTAVAGSGESDVLREHAIEVGRVNVLVLILVDGVGDKGDVPDLISESFIVAQGVVDGFRQVLDGGKSVGGGNDASHGGIVSADIIGS